MEHGLSMDARRATADTGLLGDPSCRRFLMCLWELAGAPLVVMPTVADELVGNVRQSERRHWVGVLRYDARYGNRTYPPETGAAIIEAARQAAGEWIEAELAGRGAGGIASARPGMDEIWEIDTVAQSIPHSCFRRADAENQQADRQIIAEASVLGYTLLATANLGTIRHEAVNDWLIDCGYAETPLVMDLPQAARLFAGTEAVTRLCLNAALAAALPDEDMGLARDLSAVDRFLRRLGSGHAEQCAVWAQDALEELEDPDASFAAARAGLPRRARATEMARVERTRQAAEQSGYVGMMGP